MSWKPDVPPTEVKRTLHFEYLADDEEVRCFGLPTLVIDRNHAPIDLELLGYIAEALKHALANGERTINIVLQRVPTDYLQDLIDHHDSKGRNE